MKGVAFKVTYNDGGANGGSIGFRGVCSDSTIQHNVHQRGMTNCSGEGSPCRMFADNGFKGGRPSITKSGLAWCYEAKLLTEAGFRFGGGYYHRGSKAGKPIPIKQVAPGDIAFLTTRLPDTGEQDRIIFGCFRVGARVRNKKGWGYIVESDRSITIKLPDTVALQTKFWNYHKNIDGSSSWRTGLFRYLTTEQTVEIINDIVTRLGDCSERETLLKALPDGEKFRPVRRLPVVDGVPHLGGGYGGGESAEHLKLKNFVAANPERIGLPRQSTAIVEFRYLCGDQVDIKFRLPDGTAAVVEIETVNPLPGAHQCVKYRALSEVALGYRLGSGRVQAILVAHRFDPATRAVAQKYGIRLVEMVV